MVNAKLKNFLLRAGDAAAINAGGYIFAQVDPIMNKNSFFSSNAAINSGGAAGAAQAKWRKSALYTGIGLAADAAADFVLKEDEDSGIGLVIRYATDIAYGLSAGNIAGDPVVSYYPPQYQTAGNLAAQTPVVKRLISGGMG